jgi:outer membrane immunogenic protein
MFRRILIALCVATILVTGAIAQEQPASAVSFNFNSVFTVHNGDQPSGNAAYLASFEHYFGEHSGIVLNYANVRDQKFATPTGGVQSNANELTAGYMARFPHGKLTPFVIVGGGALVFSPTNNFVLSSGGTPTTQTKAAFLYGGGADYNFTRNIAFRMQYRGLLFRSPDFHTMDLDNQAYSHLAEPSVGVVFRF